MGLSQNKYLSLKNLHLAVSVVLLVAVALVYGIYPAALLPLLFDFKVTSIDLTNMFRAQMGLYIAMSFLWAISIFKAKLWVTATIANIIFIGGLASGRLLSVVVDGTPSLLLLMGLILEFALAFWGLRNLKKYKY